MEDFWDFLCSELEILQDKKKQDIVREYGKRIAELPMGVSQWREYGKKYAYWSYFETEVREELVGELLEKARGGGNWRRIAHQLIKN